MCWNWENRVDFDLSADQQVLMASLDAMLQPFRTAPAGVHGYVEYSSALQQELTQSGFLDVAKVPGYGPLEAALLVEEAASCPVGVEVASSALIAPLLDRALEAPIALAWQLGRPARYLSIARSVILLEGDQVWVGTPNSEECEALDTVVAYPLAALRSRPRHAVRYGAEMAAAIRRRASIGIAAEAAGLMRGALDQTVRYVKDRRQFGQPLGNFQAIQHRLAEDAQLVRACRLLALRAAFADDERHAAMACLYAQEAIRKIIYDCHQFSGAMGLTLEYPLHLWTYRLKYLQGEAGGKAAQARRLTGTVWQVRDAEPLSAAPEPCVA